MNDSRIVALLKTFSPREIISLGSFIDSQNAFSLKNGYPKLNYSIKKLKQFYNILKLQYPDFTPKNIEREKIYKKLFKNAKYNDQHFRSLKSDMLFICELFLSVNNFLKEQDNHNLHLLDELRKRRLFNLFEIKLKSISSEMENRDIKDQQYFYKMYRYLNTKSLYYEVKHPLGSNMKYYKLIEQEAETLSNSFLIAMLHHILDFKDAKTYLNLDIKNDFYDYIYKYLEDNVGKETLNQIIELYFNFTKLANYNTNKEFLNKLMKSLDRLQDKMNEDNYKVLFDKCLDFCCHKYNTGDESYQDMMESMLNMAVDNDLYVRFGFMEEANYRGLINLALHFSRFELAKKIIFKYRDYVIGENKEAAFNVSYAMYLINTKELEQALDYLSRVKSRDIYYKTEISHQQLIIYYELKYYDAALNLIESYAHFLKVNKSLPHEHKENYLSFVNKLRKLIKIIIGAKHFTMDDLKNEIESSPRFIHIYWLKRKIKEYEESEKRD